MPRLPDGREPKITSRAFSESRPYHNGSDILYRRLPHEPGVYPWSDGKWIVHEDVPVLAIADGVVSFVGTDPEWKGWRVYLDHGDGFESQYRHLQPPFVKEGQHVAQGQRLGLVGPQLKNALNHLHFGLRQDGQYLDPDDFVESLPIVDWPSAPAQRPGWLLPALGTLFIVSATASYLYLTRPRFS
jgi:murein DD-endopeptidase MepM/ murein hydrolase activator NlpD